MGGRVDALIHPHGEVHQVADGGRLLHLLAELRGFQLGDVRGVHVIGLRLPVDAPGSGLELLAEPLHLLLGLFRVAELDEVVQRVAVFRTVEVQHLSYLTSVGVVRGEDDLGAGVRDAHATIAEVRASAVLVFGALGGLVSGRGRVSLGRVGLGARGFGGLRVGGRGGRIGGASGLDVVRRGGFLDLDRLGLGRGRVGEGGVGAADLDVEEDGGQNGRGDEGDGNELLGTHDVVLLIRES